MALTTDQTAPGLAQTAADVRAGLSQAKTASDARQADAERFIREESGGAAVGGHADVGNGSPARGWQA